MVHGIIVIRNGKTLSVSYDYDGIVAKLVSNYEQNMLYIPANFQEIPDDHLTFLSLNWSCFFFGLN